MRLLLLTFISLFACSTLPGQQTYQTAKPWTYWWWMGSAVDSANIQHQLGSFAEAGLGGVHIIPIYGVKGREEQFLDFLSEDWFAMADYTLQEAAKLRLGVDLTLGTGWPYGGEWMTPEFAAKKLFTTTFPWEKGSRIKLDIRQLKSQHELVDVLAVFASDQREQLDLTPYIHHGRLSRKLARSDWEITLYGVQLTGQMVKRAAPGGEGLVLDYFHGNSVRHYLNHFDSVFSHTSHPIHPRAFYHDSYEVYGANWTTGFTGAFKSLQGYDLLPHLSALQDTLHPDHPLIVHDVRATLGQLLHSEFTRKWTDWSAAQHRLTRNQAHGSPGNLLDLYGLSTIPETESFGCSDFNIPGLSCDPDYEESRFGRPDPLMMKFASSPAHLLGKPLVSSETGTWLANHFKASLRKLKPQVDELFTAGINHIFYHGITYSPGEEKFPGWLFYASTNFGLSSHFWEELPLLNRYIENCQKFLQEAQPDNDILLYFPIHDLWTRDRGELLLMLEVHHFDRWFSRTSFGRTAELLWNEGFSFDYISDRQLGQLQLDSQMQVSVSGNSKYRILVVPAVNYMPESTLLSLEKLASQGLKILFVDQLPRHYAGYVSRNRNPSPGSGSKNFLVSQSLLEDLDRLQVPREELSGKGLDFIRKTNAAGKLYFITNLGDQFLEDSLSLAAEYRYLSILDPQTGRQGYLKTSDRFHLKLPPGKSCFIQTLDNKPDMDRRNAYQACDTLWMDQGWTVRFRDWQGNDLEKEYTVDSLSSWTEWGDPVLAAFYGKARYSTGFTMNQKDTKEFRYVLHIKGVRESAEVFINGTSQGTLWAFPNELELSAETLKEENQMVVVVQNLSANYMRMYDAQHPEWKKFYDINIVDITYQPFHASDWPPEPSGLIGQAYITREKVLSDGTEESIGFSRDEN